MTPAQFAAAVRLAGADPNSRTSQAARLVLVEGRTVNGAARVVGVNNPPVTRAVNRLRDIVNNGCPTCGRPIEG